MAAPGVRGQDVREKWKKTILVLRIQKRRLAAKVRPGEARFGSELDGVKPWRRQVFGAKMREKNGRTLKLSLFSGSRSGVWQRKCDQGRLVLDQH